MSDDAGARARQAISHWAWLLGPEWSDRAILATADKLDRAETHDSSHGARLTHEGPASAKPCEANGLAGLPLLGSNQDSPDPESEGALKGDRASAALRVIRVDLGALVYAATPPAPAQGPHSAEPIHDSAQGETALCEHCGNPLSAHPLRWNTKDFGVLRCNAGRDLEPKPSFPCPDLCRHCGSDVAVCGESLCIAPHRFSGPVLP